MWFFLLNDTIDCSFHKKSEVKANCVFLNSRKDHLIPHIVTKEIVKDMYDSLVGIYQKKNIGIW